MRATVAIAGTIVTGVGCGAAESGPKEEPGSPFFPQSLASGDPRPDSVVVWTRVVDPNHANDDLTVTLEVALDRNFEQRVSFDGAASLDVVAAAASDHCVKVRVVGLTAGTIYYYRFSYEHEGAVVHTRTGRAKTAPSPDADVAVRFAVASCQDYSGRYYHAYRHMADQDVDFVIHLGDYIYETVDDPSFQSPSDTRTVALDVSEAIQVPTGGGGSFYAARSLENYRTLYRTYRGDGDLQRVHERFAMIAVQDDHEFSNDCHGATGTYFNGARDETDEERRHNADRAWFEYMPFDHDTAPASALDDAQAFPQNLTYYRDFSFGRHVFLAMTDLRRYRSDHLIAEDSFPGSVALTQADLDALRPGAMPDFAVPYVSIDTWNAGSYRDLLQAHAAELGFTAARITGLISVEWINGIVTTLNASATTPTPLIDATDPSLERGIAYHQLLKTEEFSAIGSRMLARKPPFDLIAEFRYSETSGASEQALGTDQQAWFLDRMASSTATWRLWGSEYTVMPHTIDLRGFAAAPPQFQDQFYLGLDDFDGMPNRRKELVSTLADLGNVVIVTGDLHAFLVGTPYSTDPSRRVVEFVAGSISSVPLQTELKNVVGSGALAGSGIEALALILPGLLVDPDRVPNPHLAFAELTKNGYAVAVADGATLETTCFFFDPSDVATPTDQVGNLADIVQELKFRVDRPTLDLYKYDAGAWKRWDVASYAWV